MKTYFKIRMCTHSGIYFYSQFFAENGESAIEMAKLDNSINHSKTENYECMGENYPGKRFDSNGELCK